MKKKYLAGLALAGILASNTLSVFAGEISNNSLSSEHLENEATMIIDYDNDEYKVIQDGVLVEKGSTSTSANLNTTDYNNVTGIHSIAGVNQKLTVTSSRSNPGNVRMRAVKSGTTHYAIDTLAPGTSWTTGNLTWNTYYTITAKATKSGVYSFTLKW